MVCSAVGEARCHVTKIYTWWNPKASDPQPWECALLEVGLQEANLQMVASLVYTGQQFHEKL
jgi:hypothetical protein